MNPLDKVEYTRFKEVINFHGLNTQLENLIKEVSVTSPSLNEDLNSSIFDILTGYDNSFRSKTETVKKLLSLFQSLSVGEEAVSKETKEGEDK